MEKMLMKKSRSKGGKIEKSPSAKPPLERSSSVRPPLERTLSVKPSLKRPSSERSPSGKLAKRQEYEITKRDEDEAEDEAENETFIPDIPIPDIPIPDMPGPSDEENNPKEHLTMKEYEEQLKKLQGENFNLKLKMYLVEERLGKVNGIHDKEQLIKKNIQWKVTYETQQKELDRKQELLFEASKAFEQLQKEHEAEVSGRLDLKEKEISELKSEIQILEENLHEITQRIHRKCARNYMQKISDLEKGIEAKQSSNQKLITIVKSNQEEASHEKKKMQKVENELEEKMGKIEYMVQAMEVKEHDLAAANFTVRKLEDELLTKKRRDEIIVERLSDKNQMVENLQNSLIVRDTNINQLERRLENVTTATQSLLSKVDTANFLNATLKEELETLQSRLHRYTSLSSLSSITSEEEGYRIKLEELQKSLEEREEMHNERVRALERQISDRYSAGTSVIQLASKYKKLEEDHRKACAALKTFMKRTGEEEKEREVLKKKLRNQEETVTVLKSHLEKISHNSISVVSSQNQNDEKIWPIVGSLLFQPLTNK